MIYTHEKQKIFYENKHIYTAPSKVDGSVTTKFNTYVFLYRAFDFVPYKNLPVNLRPNIKDPDIQRKVNQNILCIDREGNELWRVDPTDKRGFDHVDFMMSTDNTSVWSHRRDGEEFKIDIKTGKILEMRLGAR